jgi:fido (protein-threonine AMPylation protein)
MTANRYRATGSQAQWQPNSNEQVLLNKPGITDPVLMDETPLAEAIAICHVELILIHPFREGNGRLSRLLADVMAVQAGRGPLDYSQWDENTAAYFSAIQHGMSMDYAPMQKLVSLALAAQND